MDNYISWFVLTLTAAMVIVLCYGAWRFFSWLVDFCFDLQKNQRLATLQRMASQLEQKAANRQKIKPDKIDWVNIVNKKVPAPPKRAKIDPLKQKVELKNSTKRRLM